MAERRGQLEVTVRRQAVDADAAADAAADADAAAAAAAAEAEAEAEADAGVEQERPRPLSTPACDGQRGSARAPVAVRPALRCAYGCSRPHRSPLLAMACSRTDAVSSVS